MPESGKRRSFSDGNRSPAAPRVRAEGERGTGMSATPADVRLDQDPRILALKREGGLPLSASVYGLAVAFLALAIAVPVLLHLKSGTHGWITFAVLAAGAATTQLYVVRTAKNTSFHVTPLFLIPAVLLLPPELVALIAVVQHIPEWLKERYAWYIQSFNISIYTIANLAAWGGAHLILSSHGLVANGNLRFALAGLVACIVYEGHNVLLAPMIMMARGHTLRESGILSAESLSTEFVLATLGLAFAAFWHLNPWLLPFAVAPLFLIHRSLSVPQLQAEARVDPKTGLFNARHFATMLQEELGRAQRFDRPMSLIMADLDLLRDINNTYGHLAGDAVLRGIAEVFRGQ